MEKVLKKNESGYGGARPGSGRKPMAKKLDQLTEKAKKKVYQVLEADFWVKLANDKVAPRLAQILDDPLASSDLLKFAMKEVNDRAFGRPKESIDLTSKGKSLSPTPEQRARYAKRHVNDSE